MFLRGVKIFLHRDLKLMFLSFLKRECRVFFLKSFGGLILVVRFWRGNFRMGIFYQFWVRRVDRGRRGC